MLHYMAHKSYKCITIEWCEPWMKVWALSKRRWWLQLRHLARERSRSTRSLFSLGQIFCNGSVTYNLLHDFAGGVQVNEPLVDLELITIPGLGTLTARLRDTFHQHMRIPTTLWEYTPSYGSWSSKPWSGDGLGPWRGVACPWPCWSSRCWLHKPVNTPQLRKEGGKYAHFSRLRTLLDVSVILILWILAAGTGPAESYSFSLAT